MSEIENHLKSGSGGMLDAEAVLDDHLTYLENAVKGIEEIVMIQIVLRFHKNTGNEGEYWFMSQNRNVAEQAERTFRAKQRTVERLRVWGMEVRDRALFESLMSFPELDGE